MIPGSKREEKRKYDLAMIANSNNLNDSYRLYANIAFLFNKIIMAIVNKNNTHGVLCVLGVNVNSQWLETIFNSNCNYTFMLINHCRC